MPTRAGHLSLGGLPPIGGGYPPWWGVGHPPIRGVRLILRQTPSGGGFDTPTPPAGGFGHSPPLLGVVVHPTPLGGLPDSCASQNETVAVTVASRWPVSNRHGGGIVAGGPLCGMKPICSTLGGRAWRPVALIWPDMGISNFRRPGGPYTQFAVNVTDHTHRHRFAR